MFQVLGMNYTVKTLKIWAKKPSLEDMAEKRSLKLTASLNLKMDGWNTIAFLLGQKSYFQFFFP